MISPIPHFVEGWLPDETLFSLCSREHRLSGALLSRTTTERLFASKRLGTAHDVPARLRHFIVATNGRFGNDLEEICREHCVLGCYLPWRSRREVQLVLRIIAGEQGGSVKSVLGLPSSRWGAGHPLKLCPRCVVADKATFGTSYWHLKHQYPGMARCPVHHTGLAWCHEKIHYNKRDLWLLPEDCEVAIERDISAIPDSASFQHLLMSSAELPVGFEFDYSRLHDAYMDELAVRSLVRRKKSISWPNLVRQYLDYLADLRGNADLRALPCTTEECASHLRRVLYSSHPSRHPLPHLLFMSWLFGDWAKFWRTYTTPSQLRPVARSFCTGQSAPIGEVEEAATLAKRGASCRQIAAALGIDVGTAQTWAARCGVQAPIQRTTTRQKVVKALQRGDSKIAIAEHFGVSVQTVTRVLRSEPWLADHWHKACYARARYSARSTWLREISRHPNFSTTQVRQRQQATYAWLYRNDREWLLTHSPSKLPSTTSRGDRVDWFARDRDLSGRLMQAIHRLSARHNPLSLQILYKAVPELSRYMPKLEKLNRTRAILDSHIKRRSSKT